MTVSYFFIYLIIILIVFIICFLSAMDMSSISIKYGCFSTRKSNSPYLMPHFYIRMLLTFLVIVNLTLMIFSLILSK